MTSLEDELRRQLTVNANLRATVAATEARVADLTGRLHVDEQLSELRYAVKEGITSERVKYVSGRGEVSWMVCPAFLVQLCPVGGVEPSDATPGSLPWCAVLLCISRPLCVCMAVRV